ncbi:MAG: HAMP domain-containing protein [Alphaproteobacteria bacterium]|nr:HAMP domain-containing protein [Alphaproteobacteria bacterium]
MASGASHSGFALAAERLGRDPTASVLALEGPAEVGRAAHAFNRMQSRLRSFVDDRTAMVGAISHDLRTPPDPPAFPIEDVPTICASRCWWKRT